MRTKEETDVFQDYYEVLQLSPKADQETIDRVYRMLVKRYHPDNQETGNNAIARWKLSLACAYSADCR